MKRFVAPSVPFLMIAGSLAAAAPVRPHAQTAPIFFDDFSAAEIDRTKWNVLVTGRTVNN
jgi:hypothetical protein